MGIWQVFALASILGNPLFSVYPQRGNANVRRDIHRLIMPRHVCSGTIQYVMWTSTRKDTRDKNWIPNHFVPVLPIEVATIPSPTPIEIQRWRLMFQRKREREKRLADKARAKDDENKKPKVVEDTCNEQTKNENDDAKDAEKITENASEKEEKDERVPQNTTLVNETDLNPEHLLNKYVIVLYNGHPYPGLVKDNDKEEEYVRCMHRVGRKLEKSQFYWPKCVVDECWYG